MRWRVAAGWAAVILVVLIMGVTWLKLNSGARKQNALQAPERPTSPTPQRTRSAPNGAANDREHKLAREFPSGPRLRTRRGVRRIAPRVNEVATRFYSLVEEGELAPLESGQVVRVEVPASALITLGLPITAESMDRPVQADLLLGQDGLARAIRFLR